MNNESLFICNIIREYQNGTSLPKLAKKYGKSAAYYYFLIKNNGGKIRTRSDAARLSVGTSLDTTVFQDMSREDSCYWFGFLLADGCLYKNKTVSLTQAAIDYGHLEKFKKFVGGTQKIHGPFSSTSRQGQCYRYMFNSKLVVDRLKGHGLSERKTFIARMPDTLVNNRHAWRGLFDGDGSLYFVKQNDYPQLYVCGTETICRQFTDYVCANTKTDFRPKLREQPGCFKVVYTGLRAVLVGKLMYDNATVFLDRKKQRIDRMLGR